MLKRIVLIILLVAFTAFADDVIRRGSAIPSDLAKVPLATLLANPTEFTKGPIVTEGVVSSVCRLAGCWMQVAPEAGAPGIRVTFEDGAFAVPRGSRGRSVRMVGIVRVKGEKASFVASGVEITNRVR